MVWEERTDAVAPRGAHVLSIADDLATQLDRVAPVFRAGLAQEWRCLYVVDQTLPQAVIAGLETRGCKLGVAMRTGQFAVLGADEGPVMGGRFDPERSLDRWAEVIAETRRQGFPGLCQTGEVTWLARGIPGMDRWLEYESRSNLLPTGDYVTLICQYFRAQVPPWMLGELAKVHPVLCDTEGFRPSLGFVRPDRYLAGAPLCQDLEPPADSLPCEWVEELISADLDGQLLPRRHLEVGRHLAVCSSCRATAESFRDLKGALASLKGQLVVPDELRRGFDRRWSPPWH